MSKRQSGLRSLGLALTLALILQTLASLATPNVTATYRPQRPQAAQASGFPVLADFETGTPAGFFVYNGGASAVDATTQQVPEDSPLALPGQIGTNTVLSTTYSIADYGGFGLDFTPAPQDWSAYEGIRFWFYGRNSGQTYQAEIMDNRSDPASDTAERFDFNFQDDFAGWQQISIPFSSFTRAADFQPGGAPNDGLTLSEMWGVAFPLPVAAGDLFIDHIELYGTPSSDQTRVQLDRFSYAVQEGGTIAVTATLNMRPTSPVTVSYSTLDHTATAADYSPAGGQLVFPADTIAQSFTVATLDDDAVEGTEALTLTLADPVNASLGARSQVPLTIRDNDAEPTPTEPGVVVDDFEAGLPQGTDADGNAIGFVTWHDPNSTVAITTTTPPAPVPGHDPANAVLQLDSSVESWGGLTHAFADAGLSQWTTQDWSTYEGLSFWLYGSGSGTTLFVEVLDNRQPGSTSDTAERFSFSFSDDVAGWRLVSVPFGEFRRKDIGNGAPNDGFTLTQVHGWAFGSLNTSGPQTFFIDDVTVYGNVAPPPTTVAFDGERSSVTEGDTATIKVVLSAAATEPVTVSYSTTESHASPDLDFLASAGTLVFEPGSTEETFTLETLEDSKHEGNEALILQLPDAQNVELGYLQRLTLTIVDDDAQDPLLLDDFTGFHRFQQTSGNLELSISDVLADDALALPQQGSYEQILRLERQPASGPASLSRTFAEPQDWSATRGLSFWYHGTGSGETIQVALLDNVAAATADLHPDQWQLVWSDEFDGAAGTAPDPNIWQPEIGDGALNGIPGWGNSEDQYYTDSTENAAMDGAGHLAITARASDPSTSNLRCWYGPCRYTSARLITRQRIELEYGRIEARIKVPAGVGLWPAFWMLGNDIGEVGWPRSGEIDIMEFVGREPYEVFGTIHGPGYSGGSAFGNTHTFDQPVSDEFHTFAIEWRPGRIDWFVDGINYHSATPADVQPNDWVYEHPFFLLLNLAVGGNFGGPVGDDVVFPRTMLVDYVRVYGAADSAERFSASFTTRVAGWHKVFIPFTRFKRSATQPSGAPNDGLGLSEVWGYGLSLPQSSSAGPVYIDQVRLMPQGSHKLLATIAR